MDKKYTTDNRFPNQLLTTAEKIEKFGSVEKWGQYQVDSILRMAGDVGYDNNQDVLRKQVLYDLAAGILNEDDYKHVCKPFGADTFEFPASLVHYDLISPKLNLLKGEEIKRPFNFRIVSTNTDGYSESEEKKKQMAIQMLQQQIMQELQASGIDVNQPENQEKLTPEGIKQYMHSYQSNREMIAQQSMDFLVPYLRMPHKFNKGWNHLLISGEEIYWTGIINGEPACRVVNPLYFAYDRNPDLEFIDEASWAREVRFMSATAVHDEFRAVLNDEERRQIEEMKGGNENLTIEDSGLGVPVSYATSDIDNGNNSYIHNSQVYVKVAHIEWVSLRKIGYLTFLDEFNQPQQTIVDENYKVDRTKGQTIEWDWITETWEADKIGNGIYKNIRPKPNQYKSLDNPSAHRLGYTGVQYNNLNSKPYSLVEVMKPHQYLYNVILYRLELEIAKAQGKKLVMDISQIPKTYGFNVDKWMHYFNVLGIAFVNPHEEGKGKLGQGKTSNFNQFTAIDLSMARVIDQYVMILSKIEEMLGDITGITKQRQGQVSSSELVGNVERTITQSSHITEPLFYTHNEVKRRVLTNLLEETKLAWIDGKKVQYVMDDFTKVFFEADGEIFPNSEYGVFVSNSTRDHMLYETIKQLAQTALQSSQAELKDIVAILETDSIAKAKIILDEASERAHERQMQMQEQQSQSAQQIQQMVSQDKEADRELKKYEIDTRASTEIHKAEIMSFLGQKDQDIDNDGVPDQLELEKLRVAREKNATEARLKDKELGLKDKEIASKERMKKEDNETKIKVAKSKPKPKK